MFGSLVSGTISDLLGRKTSLMLSGIPAVVGWLMIGLAHFVAQSNATVFYSVLLIGRILTGFSGGWSLTCVAVSHNITMAVMCAHDIYSVYYNVCDFC